MSKSYAILPCNGLDKCAGCISKEVALQLSEQTDSEIMCPVFYRVADSKYNKLAEEKSLLVIDGCATRCASKLAIEKGLKITEKINVSDVAKEQGFSITKGLRLGGSENKFAQSIVSSILATKDKEEMTTDLLDFPDHLEYVEFTKDKFIFRLPKETEFLYSENDCWAYIKGNKARIGVTDYVQKSLSDILYFTPPAVGSEIEQFEDAGNIESGKAIYEIISPLSGTITAVNSILEDTPELINDSPYEKAWIFEMELSAAEEDSELLLEFDDYLQVMKRKVDEFHV